MTEPTQQDGALRVAELEAELAATRRDYQNRLGELAQRAAADRAPAPTADTGLYAMLLGIERERQELQTALQAERQQRLAVEAAAGARTQELLAVEAERDGHQARAAELTAEHDRRLAELTAEHDRRLAELTAEHDRVAAELERSTQWAAILDDRARVLERSLAFALGRAILDPLKRVPGARTLARLARRRR